MEQMQLIADIEDRVRKNERVAHDGMLLPLTGHVMTPEEINAARKENRLPLEPFTQTDEPTEEPAITAQPVVTQEKRNFHITDDDLGAGGPKAKFRANMDAIHLLKTLEAEGRLATAEEQEVLSRFVGWGGISQAFDPDNASWAKEYAEVKAALTPEEYREARASTLNAFYTSPTVIKAMENCSDAELTIAQDKLNRAYDSFTAQYGLISSNANRRAFSQDSSYCLLASLEILDEEGKLKRKADIFTKRTIRRPEAVTSVDTASEALAVSIGERAKVDVPFMAQLAGKTEDEITEELAGVIFKNPLTDQWEMSDEYLSGNVREKLDVARQFAENHPEIAINVAYLERVQPKDLDASEIEVRLGATWIKPEYVQEFMQETFHTPWYMAGRVISVSYSDVTGVWNVSGKSRDVNNPLVNATFGTTRANAYRLLEDGIQSYRILNEF